MSRINADNFALPVLDNTYSVVSSKAKIPTLKKIGGVEKLIDTEEYLGIEAMESTVIDWLGDKNARKIGVLPANNQTVKIYGLGLAGISSTRFHLCDLGMAEQRVIVSFKRKKLASKYPASEIDAVMNKLVYQAVSSWPSAIIHGGFPIHFGVLSRILLSEEYQQQVRRTKFSYDTLNVLEPYESKEFWYQVYATHFELANKLQELGYSTQANQVIQQLELTLNTPIYQQAIIQTFGQPDLTILYQQMSDLYQEREKMKAATLLVDHIPAEENVENKPSLDEGLETKLEYNVDLINEIKSNPTKLDEIKNHNQLDDMCIELGGKKWIESKYLHNEIDDPGATKLNDKKLVVRQFIEQFDVTQ